MIIDGKNIAETLLDTLKTQTSFLKSKGIIPTLAVILVGDDPGSLSYVRQKEKAAERIGAELKVMRYEVRVKKDILQKKIKELNVDPTVHGIIIQLPLPPHIDISIHRSVLPNKDVDGFVPGSKFDVPVALAVEKILQRSYELGVGSYEKKEFYNWLKQQRIVVIGRGETAGKPIAQYFINLGCTVSVVHSQTSEGDKQRKIQSADIIISCVGKKQVLQGATKGATLISVGICRDSEGKLHGDYEEDDIKDSAAFYTPTPGGVGPVNVACLMENLITAASS